jgi:predicted nicotinamide N-methyase
MYEGLAPFDAIHEDVIVGGLRLPIARPRSAEDLIDEADYARDERLPYWAELWPSAQVLAAELAPRDLSGMRIIELGCGVGLPSVVAALRGAHATATDWYDEALDFARANAHAAGARLETRPLDWNAPPDELVGPDAARDLAIGADLLYEQRNGPALAALLPRLLKPGAEALIADPRRPHADALLVPLLDEGWEHEMSEVQHTGRPDESGRVIQLHRLIAPRR